MVIAIIFGVIKEFFDKYFGNQRRIEDEEDNQSQKQKESINKSPFSSENQHKFSDHGKYE